MQSGEQTRCVLGNCPCSVSEKRDNRISKGTHPAGIMVPWSKQQEVPGDREQGSDTWPRAQEDLAHHGGEARVRQARGGGRRPEVALSTGRRGAQRVGGRGRKGQVTRPYEGMTVDPWEPLADPEEGKLDHFRGEDCMWRLSPLCGQGLKIEGW